LKQAADIKSIDEHQTIQFSPPTVIETNWEDENFLKAYESKKKFATSSLEFIFSRER